jgi:galactokinase
VADSSRDRLMAETRARFIERFGRPPRTVAIAPARVNLIGEHTDYSAGFVLPAALPLYTCVALARATGTETTMVSTKFGEQILPAKEPGASTGFARYLAGAIEESGLAGLPLAIMVHGNMPVEAGLSSSASLLVATLAALANLAHPADAAPPPDFQARLAVAHAAREVENNYIGVPCGFMDQYAVACCEADHAMLLDCFDNRHTSVRAELRAYSWLIVYSAIRRELVAGGYGARVEAVRNALKLFSAANLDGPGILRTHSPDAVLRLAKGVGVSAEHLPPLAHISAENARVHLMRHALERGDATTVATILRLGHESLSQQFGVSLPAIDEFVAAGYKLEGVKGLRLTGAGMGGSLVALVQSGGLDEIKAKLESLARQTMSLEAEVYEIPAFVEGVTWR